MAVSTELQPKRTHRISRAGVVRLVGERAAHLPVVLLGIKVGAEIVVLEASDCAYQRSLGHPSHAP